jgi:hypothetical protein
LKKIIFVVYLLYIEKSIRMSITINFKPKYLNHTVPFFRKLFRYPNIDEEMNNLSKKYFNSVDKLLQDILHTTILHREYILNFCFCISHRIIIVNITKPDGLIYTVNCDLKLTIKNYIIFIETLLEKVDDEIKSFLYIKK